MKIERTSTGYQFENLDILHVSEAYSLIYTYGTKALIKALPTNTVIDFQMFYLIVESDDITIVLKHGNKLPLYAIDFPIIHCNDAFKNIGSLPKLHYNRFKYGELIRLYKWYSIYKFNRR